MNWKKFLPHIIAIITFLAVAIGLFPESFQGKVVVQPDMQNYRGLGDEAKEFYEKTGEATLWTNKAFGGMPTIIWGGARYDSNLLKHLHNYIISLNLPRPPAYFFVAFASFYLLMLVLGVNPWLGIVGALAFGLSSYNFLIYEAGHGSKFLAIIYFPLVAAGTLLTYQKKYLLGALIYAIGFGLEIWSGHFQMTYYLGFALGIYVIVKFIFSILNGELPQFFKASLVLVLASLLAFGSNTAKLWSTYDYMKESIRGPAILTPDTEAAQDNNSAGLDKDYVFQWSQGIDETFTLLIPGFLGGASQEHISKDSETYKDLRKKGASGAALSAAPLYWGELPFTSGPVYMGAIVCFLFVLGLFTVKGELKWWLLSATVITIMLSWGKNLMWFSDIFYYYFPFYSKFRAVSSILTIPQFTMPLLGILGVSAIAAKKMDTKAVQRAIIISFAIVGGFCLIIAIMGGSFFSFDGVSDDRLAAAGYSVDALVADRISLMQGDAWRSFIFIALSAALLWLFTNEKIEGAWKTQALFIGLGVLTVVDLGGLGKRYLNKSNFVAEERYERQFTEKRPVDEQILQDPDPHYRVFDMSVSSFNSNVPARNHKNIGGYHPAKLRRYQDLIEKQIGTGNQKVMDMLNMKYLISQQQQPQQNPNALGNAWFVSNIQKVNSADEEMAALSNFEPKTTAVIHSEFDTEISSLQASGNGTIELTDYKPNQLTYKTSTNGEELAVFSEVWYNPGKGKGWQAYIDGKEVDHIRANYVLRALKIPEGEHTIEFKFFPTSYYTGSTISLICSSILLLGAIAYLVLSFLNAKKEEELVVE